MQIIIIFYYRLICLQTYGLMRMTTEGDCSSTWSITRWGWREWPWWWSFSLRTGNAGMQCRFLKQRKNLLKKNYWGKNCINLKYYTKCALKLWRHVWSSNYSVFVLFFFRDKPWMDMVVSDREITVFSDWCSTIQCKFTCVDAVRFQI